MPKESILNSLEGDIAVEVHWGRDMLVEIASVNLTKEQHTEERGWFTELNRDAINKLIKVLRRARDQAYGADE